MCWNFFRTTSRVYITLSFLPSSWVKIKAKVFLYIFWGVGERGLTGVPRKNFSLFLQKASFFRWNLDTMLLFFPTREVGLTVSHSWRELSWLLWWGVGGLPGLTITQGSSFSDQAVGEEVKPGMPVDLGSLRAPSRYYRSSPHSSST